MVCLPGTAKDVLARWVPNHPHACVFWTVLFKKERLSNLVQNGLGGGDGTGG